MARGTGRPVQDPLWNGTIIAATARDRPPESYSPFRFRDVPGIRCTVLNRDGYSLSGARSSGLWGHVSHT